MLSSLLCAALHFAAILETNSPVLIVRKGEQIGAAVLVDASGLVVTCLHCTGRRDRVEVGFKDGSILEAIVVARSPKDDLALLKLDDAGQWRYLPASLARSVRQGEPVTVLGHPKGYTYTLTSGTVTALKRKITLPDGDPVEGLLQTDAAMNPGNSGGAMFNSKGELLGIPLAIHEGAQGIGFAIPAAKVRELLEQAKASR